MYAGGGPGVGMVQSEGPMELREVRVEGRGQARHRGWMLHIVAAGPSIDAELVGADADNTD